MNEFIKNIAEIGENVYISLKPEIFDITDPESEKILTIIGKTTASINITKNNSIILFSLLQLSLKNTKIICWNYKNLVSYFLKTTNKFLNIENSSIIDLKVIETYLGLKQIAPKTFPEAINRLKSIITEYKESQLIYKNIHLPLITNVIPKLENIGILGKDKKLHAYYEINGQENGRLNCTANFKDCFIPNTLNILAENGSNWMTNTNNDKLLPLEDNFFMYFDIKNMEVAVLGHLSKDEKLQEILKQDNVYETICEIATNEKDRIKGKKIFLPVIYGIGKQLLAKKLEISQENAENIIYKLKNHFPIAFQWVESYQNIAKEKGVCKDIFGKKRYFDKNEEYRARNFAIQSPASTICLDKLVELNKNINSIAFVVHDGFCVYATKNNWKQIFKIAYDILIKESNICSGLKFRVSCKAGKDLNNLRKLK